MLLFGRGAWVSNRCSQVSSPAITYSRRLRPRSCPREVIRSLAKIMHTDPHIPRPGIGFQEIQDAQHLRSAEFCQSHSSDACNASLVSGGKNHQRYPDS